MHWWITVFGGHRSCDGCAFREDKREMIEERGEATPSRARTTHRAASSEARRFCMSFCGGNRSKNLVVPYRCP